ncbi:MAG: hypothetical protein KDD40_00190 [Bdellovibrionales bacterium]|nr:hypothetical protein [Bdellovibrionales bacterium]
MLLNKSLFLNLLLLSIAACTIKKTNTILAPSNEEPSIEGTWVLDSTYGVSFSPDIGYSDKKGFFSEQVLGNIPKLNSKDWGQEIYYTYKSKTLEIKKNQLIFKEQSTLDVVFSDMIAKDPDECPISFTYTLDKKTKKIIQNLVQKLPKAKQCKDHYKFQKEDFKDTQQNLIYKMDGERLVLQQETGVHRTIETYRRISTQDLDKLVNITFPDLVSEQFFEIFITKNSTTEIVLDGSEYKRKYALSIDKDSKGRECKRTVEVIGLDNFCEKLKQENETVACGKKIRDEFIKTKCTQEMMDYDKEYVSGSVAFSKTTNVPILNDPVPVIRGQWGYGEPK